MPLRDQLPSVTSSVDRARLIKENVNAAAPARKIEGNLQVVFSDGEWVQRGGQWLWKVQVAAVKAGQPVPLNNPFYVDPIAWYAHPGGAETRAMLGDGGKVVNTYKADFDPKAAMTERIMRHVRRKAGA